MGRGNGAQGQGDSTAQQNRGDRTDQEPRTQNGTDTQQDQSQSSGASVII